MICELGMRVYKRKPGSRRYGEWDKSKMELAIQACKNDEISITQAVKTFGVPRNALTSRVKGTHQKRCGGQPVLNEQEEAVIVKYLILLSEWGFPYAPHDIRYMVKLYLDQQGRTVQRFKDNFPGNDWYRTFMERHKDYIKERVGQNIKRKRAEVSHAILDEYFDNLLAEIEGLPPTNIINFDETNVQDDPGKRKLVFKHGCKYLERLLNSSKAAISIMFSGSASGDVLPAYVVYKSINMWDSWTTGGPPKTRYNNTPSGWFDMRCFEDWFKIVIMPYRKKVSGRLIVIGDNLSSHHSVEVVELCKEITLILFVYQPTAHTSASH